MYDDIVGRCYYGAYGAIQAPSALARRTLGAFL